MNKLPSNRNFGIVFFVVFLLIALYPIVNNQNVNIWSLIIAFIFFFLGIINSNLLNPLNKVWFKFGLLLGKFISPLVMGIIFFFVVTPTGLIMRLFRKDLLNLKYNENTSYWVEKNGPKSKMKNQF